MQSVCGPLSLNTLLPVLSASCLFCWTLYSHSSSLSRNWSSSKTILPFNAIDKKHFGLCPRAQHAFHMWSNICTQASKKFTCMHMQTHTYRHVWTKRATTTTKPLLCMMHSDIFFCVLFYSILSIYLILIYFNSILSYSYKPHSWETGHGTFHLLAVTSFHM